MGLGVLVAFPIAYVVSRQQLMSRDGVLAAIVVSSLSFALGLPGFLLMFTFFATSTALTKLKYEVKAGKGAAERAGGRNWRQVVGAGGVACAIALPAALALRLWGDARLGGALLLAYASAIAVSNADTWAVEVGALSRASPRLIVKPWVKVPPGTSGGVTLLGEIASISGALVVAATYATLCWLAPLIGSSWAVNNLLAAAAVVALSGWAGEVLDSVVGATLQVKYFCPKCRVLSDTPVHRCGSRCKFHSGLRWVTNEVTNIIATSIVAAAAFLAGYLIL